MLDLFRASYIWLDLLIGFGSPLVLLWAHASGRISVRWWRLFWLGAAVGLTWEVPIFVLSTYTSVPIVSWPTALPLSPMILMVSHTLWDGGLFIVGVWLVRLLRRAEPLRSFRPSELVILILWGQLSELCVELSATLNNAWAFVPTYSFNPVLFPFRGHAITLLPQLIWLAAPIAYYLIALRFWGDDEGSTGG